jgi:hypothetical protein
MPNEEDNKEVDALAELLADLGRRTELDHDTWAEENNISMIEENTLDGFLDVMRNADAVAYFARQQAIGDDNKERGNLWYLWKRYPTSPEEGNWGALETFKARTDSLRCERDSRGKVQIWFRKQNTLVKLSRGDEKRFAAMALVVRGLICADNAKFISVVSALSTTLRAANWDWEETLLFLDAVSLGSAQKLGKKAIAQAKRAYSEGAYDTLEDIFGWEKAAILRACLDGADRN